MSASNHTAEALDLLFTSTTPGWFSPFTEATAGLTAAQAATVPAPHFNSVWAVVNHVCYWQKATLRQLQGLPVDSAALGSADGSGWPAVGEASGEAGWQAARKAALEANAELVRYVAGLSEAELDTGISDGESWNTRRHLVYSMIAHNSYHTCEITTIRHMQGWWFDAM
ncbi:DinB family protein [Ktedonosporobacter rubrisoli]|uniref:DinB family protein n=1 Tax=Ktedonosporobacter rubrisoli TaxID=2509675 RepID=A0A4P6JZ20_KTERU|nr:DinB family protein [Ktedonosporobacter rubrisoli]QBD80835.1 DinB family protein [Ktedonosporobacter rubrisoli]